MPAKNLTKILIFGDVSGAQGRLALKKIIPSWQKKYQPSLIIANVENLAHNKGVTLKTLEEIRRAGVQLFTGGNHIWAKDDIPDLASHTDFSLACPLNDSRTPDKFKSQDFTTDQGLLITVINLQGQIFMDSDYTSNPFLAVDRLLTNLATGRIILVDMHAEATSEKRAMGFYLDGRATLVYGTHTHVGTNDSQILPNGTAYISDIGMTGPYDSILGVKKEVIIEKFLTSGKIRHELPDTGQMEVNAILLEVDNNSLQAQSITPLRKTID